MIDEKGQPLKLFRLYREDDMQYDYCYAQMIVRAESETEARQIAYDLAKEADTDREFPNSMYQIWPDDSVLCQEVDLILDGERGVLLSIKGR